MLFELHITADENIHKTNENTIVIKNYGIDGNIVSIHHMTSIEFEEASFTDALCRVANYVNSIEKFCTPQRIKLECPPCFNMFKYAVYMEAHTRLPAFNMLPKSFNTVNPHPLYTDRVTNKGEYGMFLSYYTLEDTVCELCLLDTNMEMDDIWFKGYESLVAMFSKRKD